LAQIEKLGFKGDQVKHCVISHLDPDHIGGLADFPSSEVHISAKEYEDFLNGENRYRGIQLAHDPILRTYDQFPDNWFGLEAKKLSIDSTFDIYMVPLPGQSVIVSRAKPMHTVRIMATDAILIPSRNAENSLDFRIFGTSFRLIDLFTK